MVITLSQQYCIEDQAALETPKAVQVASLASKAVPSPPDRNMDTPSRPLHVAIVGGGLCGLALAIALERRSISFTIYEARPSFTELGAGINLGPNTLEALRLIDPALIDEVLRLCTRNPPPEEHLWMTVRFGGPTKRFKDANIVTKLNAPPTGNATVRRNDLLQLLANSIRPDHVSFNKKVVNLTKTVGSVALAFSDGTTAAADVIVGCDGIHSVIRRDLLGVDNPAANPQYSGVGAYRAVVPMHELEAAVGPSIASSSTLFLGPDAYIIMYPVELGTRVNIGLWVHRLGPVDEREWVDPSTREEVRAQFSSWGQTVHKIIALVGNPSFWPTFCHTTQPISVSSDRVCLIGDSAHSMPPHQGAGAGQAIEDAYVLGEVLSIVSSDSDWCNDQIEDALKAYSNVRSPRSQKVLETSVEAMDFWCSLYRDDVTEEEIQHFARVAQERFHWIWHDNIADQARRARDTIRIAK